MIRTFLEFLLSRSVDNQEQPAPWLQRHLEQDAELKRFRHESQQLDTLLKQSAIERRQAMVQDPPAPTLTLPPKPQARSNSRTSSHRLSPRWLSALAVSAVLLIALVPNWLRPTPPAIHAGEFSQQLTVVPGEVLRLITQAAKTSQTRLPELSPLSSLSMPELPAWEEVTQSFDTPMRQEIDSWQETLRNIKSRLSNSSAEIE